MKLNNILIASGNKHKKEKLNWIISDYFSKIDYLDTINFELDIDENGETFEENAQIKAIEYSKQYDGYVISTDAGVMIPALGDKWNGLRTKRFAGEHITDDERIKIVLEMMKDKTGEDRVMVWKEAIAIAKGGKVLFSIEVEGSKGVMATSYNEKNYREGIWVCSIWDFPQFNKNFFELNESEIKSVEKSWYLLKEEVTKYLSNFSE